MAYYLPAGDYYRARMGDPFIGALLGKAVPIVGGLAKKALGKVFGRRAAGPAISKVIPPAILQRIPKILRTGGAIAAGGAAFELGGRAVRIDPATGLPIRSRRMNVANVKALRRAIRREKGFIKLARRTGLVAVPRAKFKKTRKR